MDDADRAQGYEEREREAAIAAIARINAAHESERGDSVMCADCGDDIGEQRLRAVPYAIRCVLCQEIIEGEP